jgi:magnesium chelatase subunit I
MNNGNKSQKGAAAAGVYQKENSMALFPFAAVVNQDKAKEALLLAVINPAVQGVLFLGEKGTGKTTLVRSLSTLLSETQVIDLPLGCGEEMVLGTVDAEKALATGKVAVKPGILTRADGHILYIDEVNLLADHLMDIILDAAATGQYRLEREGISSNYSARFILVGSMNPEEGWLRPQLLDRFGLAVHISAIASVKKRAEVFNHAQSFAADPEAFVQSYQAAQQEITKKLRQSRERVGTVTIPEKLINQTIETILQLGVRTHRAELAILQGAKARAAWYRRGSVSWEDIQTVMPLALQHRLATEDIQSPVTWNVLDKRLLEISSRSKDEVKKGWFPTPFYRKKKAKMPRN